VPFKKVKYKVLSIDHFIERMQNQDEIKKMLYLDDKDN
jgi:hypothetical protein